MQNTQNDPRQSEAQSALESSAFTPDPTLLDKVSGNSCISQKADLNVVPLEAVLRKIKSGAYQASIENIRKLNERGDKEAATKAKKNLSYFVYGIVKGPRKAENVIQANGIVFDFDDIEDTEAFKQEAAQKIPCAKYLFRSPGNGVKVLVPFSKPVSDRSQYKLIWDNLAEEIEHQMKVKPDATADICRACFVSWDPFLLITANEPLDPDMFAGLAEEKIPAPVELPPAQIVPVSEPDLSDPEIHGTIVNDPSEYYVRLAVEHLCQQSISYRDWTKVCIALYNHMGEEGRKYWNMFLHNPNYPNETQENLDKLWESLQKYPSIKIGTLFYIAGNKGWRNVVAPQAQYYSLEDYPELIAMFESKKDVPLDRSKLPDELNGYIDILNQITDSSEGAKLTAFLPVVAACIGNRIAINNAGTRHFCNIWAVIIGPSSISRKSTVINQALKCLDTHRKSLQELSTKEKIEQSIELTRPTQARLLNLLSLDSNRLIVHTEMGAWMKEMQKSYNQGMKAELTDMFDGSDKAVAKIGIDEYISKPAFSIIGGTTEEWFLSELQGTGDQLGGFLQRHLVCFYRDIDVQKMDFSYRNNSNLDKLLYAYGEPLETLRALKGTHYLRLCDEAVTYRNEVYTEKMRLYAPKGNDPLISYLTRIYDNYFFRFCILLVSLKSWQDIKEAIEESAVANFFKKRTVDIDTAKEAMYLCDYYFENTKPFLADLAEGGKLENEKKIVNILRDFGVYEMPHHRLLTASRLTGYDFRRSIESLIERQALICIERKEYQNRIARYYKLNPVLV